MEEPLLLGTTTPFAIASLRLAATALSVVLFCVALSQPAFALFGKSGTTADVRAWRLLFAGWQAVQLGYVEWLANPLLWLSWLLSVASRRSTRPWALATAIASFALMLGFLGRAELTVAAHSLPILRHEAGYWLWLGSAALMMGSQLIGSHRLWRTPQPEPPQS